MKLNKIDKEIKCDTVLCNNNANYELICNSYKGNSYLCDNCLLLLQNTLKGRSKNESKSI